jgi:hypothetical protein
MADRTQRRILHALEVFAATGDFKAALDAYRAAARVEVEGTRCPECKQTECDPECPSFRA